MHFEKLAVVHVASGAALIGFTLAYYLHCPLNPIQICVLFVAAGLLILRGCNRAEHRQEKIVKNTLFL